MAKIFVFAVPSAMIQNVIWMWRKMIFIFFSSRLSSVDIDIRESLVVQCRPDASVAPSTRSFIGKYQIETASPVNAFES